MSSAALNRLVKEAEQQITTLQAIVAELKHHTSTSLPRTREDPSPVSATWARTDRMIKAKVFKLAKLEGISAKAAFSELHGHTGKSLLKLSV